MTVFSDRRGFLVSGTAMTLAGCAHCTFPEPSAAAEGMGDAHAHFFNAADLPVAGFAKFVLIPRYFGNFPDFGLALVDIMAWIAKALSLTADAEMRELGRGTLRSRGVPTSTDFGREAAVAHQAGLSGRPADPDVDRLGPINGPAEQSLLAREDSHRALARLLLVDAAGRRARIALTAQDFEAIVSGREGTATAADLQLQCLRKPVEFGDEAARSQVRQLLRWAYLMCQPRCSHVETYLQTIRREGAGVLDAVNLLVDYDKWLDDGPRKGSETDRQVEYWTRYADIAGSVTGRIRLHTFAGFDPLRDAEERVLEGRSSTTLMAMKRWAREGKDSGSTASHRIAGFKLYPPMGFRPDDNRAIEIPAVRGGVEIRRRWGTKLGQIGTEIDRSLEDFFDFCVIEDVPVLTHARESNIALPGHDSDPSPGHWLDLARRLHAKHPQRPPLRLCIGHFDMISCLGSQSDRDVLREALRLNAAGRTRIYFDLSFDDRILAGRGSELLAELAEVCRQENDEGQYIMFGSDWIMLANQVNVGSYLQLAYSAARNNTFWEPRLDQLFRANLQRFLQTGSRQVASPGVSGGKAVSRSS